MPKKNAKRLYHKLLFTYSAIIICIVFALMIYFISATKSRILEMNLDYMEMMGAETVSYLVDCGNSVININNELYRNDSVMQDVIQYLQLEEGDYQSYRLDTFIKSTSPTYIGIDGFAEKILGAEQEIFQMDFLSYSKGEITSFYQGGRNQKNKVTKMMMEKIANENFETYNSFSFLKEIRDSGNGQSVGCMIITFSMNKISTIKPSYKTTEMILMNNVGTLLFDSKQNHSPEIIQRADGENKMGQLLGAYVSKKTTNRYMVYTYVEKKKASRIPFSVFLSILTIGAVTIAIGEIFVHYYLKKLTNRLNYILEGMQKVTTGELGIRLNVDVKGDELDLIAENFNEMCEKLNRYIQKIYMAEIEQKNAEIEVLQNQINPHFLYNTLEAIRMKAICNGDREVGKMLYSMAVIFRSQLKDSDIITVIQEIHYCKKYLELFEFRYPGKFTFSVECPEEFMNYPIIKFLIQPVLENYFVHGIRSEVGGNHIWINVEKEEQFLKISVKDNGQGMSQEELLEKNRVLKENATDSRKSIGLINVNRRLKAVYGSNSGLHLAHRAHGGLCVTMRAELGDKME